MTDSNVVPMRTPQRAGLPDLEGDYLNSARFMAAYGDSVRRAPELGRWFIWNGSWWEEDRTDVVLDLASDVVEGLREWVTETSDPKEFARRSRHYEASSRAGRREAMLAVVGTERDVVVRIDDLDAHPMLLAARNGTIDLATGELRPADPADLLTLGVDVDYDPEAYSDEWLRFLDRIFDKDEELLEYTQRLLGYCITGVVRDHILPVLHGQGANGKSTMVGAVQDLLGDHAMTAPDGLVVRQRHEAHPERVASLRGRRLVVSIELEEKVALAEQTVKMLTGGDILSARELYGRRFNFKPSHKVLLVTNHRPKVRGTDHAIWRRIKLLPFTVTISDE
jgi:putative DNA primase/helicase